MKKTEVSLLFVFVMQASSYCFIRKSKIQIEQILKTLNRISHQLDCNADYRKRKMMIYVFCMLMYGLILAFLFTYFYSDQRINDQAYLKNSTLFLSFSKLNPNFLPMLRDFSVSSHTLVNSIFVIGSTACYAFLCIEMRCLFLHITYQIQSVKSKENVYQLLHAYDELANVLSDVDSIFSYTVFVLVLSSMAGLFWSTYSLIFLQKTHLEFITPFWFSGFYFVIVLLAVILSASETARAGNVAREWVVSLPGFFPLLYLELKIQIRKNFKREIALTLWKMYTIDRSLLFSALGTLVTYGILIATLGNVQS
ncbi:hypothetical protein HNY73_001401 [Argiope bruennichi]|uniref:Gustatory receptor n=1 Tax=Argiope bruennichi TaxID=94029 RepID=A0A8T0G162_ARGBR|nr:hypothetical protein HNY73_001401 [Argiope bruennichi]